MNVARRVRVAALGTGLVWILTGSAAQAHVADTSYARFKVTRQEIEAKFSFDFGTLARIVPGLDANGDRVVSGPELTAETPAVCAYLRQQVQFEINGEPADFGAEQPVSFPPDAGAEGIPEAKFHDVTSITHFVFRRSLAAPPADFWVRFDVFRELGPRHVVLGAIEQDGRKQEVLFQESEPDYLFDTGYAPAGGELARGGESNEASQSAPPAPAPVGSRNESAAPSQRSNTSDSPWAQISRFFKLGVEHIFLGYDHILFLLSLLVVSRLRELVKIVTSFTVAHTITLMLATLDVVRLPSRLVESAIAATIVYVAVENFWVRDTSHRWRLTFFCGLIHGFGFAGVLQELGLPAQGMVRSLVAFNCGVEAGQLVIVVALLPLVTLLARWRYGKQARLAISAAIALCGAGWLIDRVFGLGLMPF